MAPPFKREDVTPAPEESTETVILRSPSGKEFVLHARPLAHHSRYFRTALNSKFQEATTREFNFVEYCSDKVLRVFTRWIYLRSSGLAYQTVEVPFLYKLGQAVVVEAWLFGDYIQAPLFQNEMMALMVAVSNKKFDIDLLPLLVKMAPQDSPLRKYLVDRFCSMMLQSCRESIDAAMSVLPAHFTTDVCKKLFGLILDKEKWVGGKFYDWNKRTVEDYQVQVEGTIGPR
ncbi:hypothetical protein F5Y01DRAFT_310549 [Xylaria sp. FL0043]|nr:hypothetical protein F5Y01DRAFT_310549 [Xylaria sp. FL0043]